LKREKEKMLEKQLIFVLKKKSRKEAYFLSADMFSWK